MTGVLPNGQGSSTKHCIAMVCDFFFPRLGGVENHIYQLAQCLILRGHKVIVITHSFGDRNGVRYLTNGLKVYYTATKVLVEGATPPLFFPFFPIFRRYACLPLRLSLPLPSSSLFALNQHHTTHISIVIREGVTVVHGHQSTSPLSNESMMHAKSTTSPLSSLSSSSVLFALEISK